MLRQETARECASKKARSILHLSAITAATRLTSIRLTLHSVQEHIDKRRVNGGTKLRKAVEAFPSRVSEVILPFFKGR
eukprot:6441846-Pyramimonas_sp.AAC.1